MHTCTCTQACMYTHTCMHVHTYACTHTHMHTQTHTHMHTHKHTHTQTHSLTHTYLLLPPPPLFSNTCTHMHTHKNIYAPLKNKTNNTQSVSTSPILTPNIPPPFSSGQQTEACAYWSGLLKHAARSMTTGAQPLPLVNTSTPLATLWPRSAGGHVYADRQQDAKLP